MSNSVFFDEWRRCLMAHYQDVVRRNDRLTEQSLIQVMTRVGFREDELRQLYIEATMHVDNIPADFTPAPPFENAAVVSAYEEPTFVPHAAECSCPACMEQVDTLRHDTEGQPLSVEEQYENFERAAYEADDPPLPPDSPFQRSLF